MAKLKEPFCFGAVGAAFLLPRTALDTLGSAPNAVPKHAACVWLIADEMPAMEAPVRSLVLIDEM
jgi:hypothetical protein